MPEGGGGRDRDGTVWSEMGRYAHLGPFELEGPEDFAAARRALASALF